MTDEPIAGFQGEHRFLSNFWPVKIEMAGHVYPSVEHAYQASKTLPANRAPFREPGMSAGSAKKLGRTIPLIDGWTRERDGLGDMLEFIRQKFDGRDPELVSLLLATGEAELIEGNDWHDSYWGVCRCGRCPKGLNVLGSALMLVRSEIQPTTLGAAFSAELRAHLVDSQTAAVTAARDEIRSYDAWTRVGSNERILSESLYSEDSDMPERVVERVFEVLLGNPTRVLPPRGTVES